jgi:hypothetical protein
MILRLLKMNRNWWDIIFNPLTPSGTILYQKWKFSLTLHFSFQKYTWKLSRTIRKNFWFWKFGRKWVSDWVYDHIDVTRHTALKLNITAELKQMLYIIQYNSAEEPTTVIWHLWWLSCQSQIMQKYDKLKTHRGPSTLDF